MSIAQQRSRAPDAAQRLVSGALQSRGHLSANATVSWVSALRSNACALQRVRDTRGEMASLKRGALKSTPDMRKRPWGAGAFCSRLGVGVVYISTWRLWGAGKEPREFTKLV